MACSATLPGFVLQIEIAGDGGQPNQRLDDLAGGRRNGLIDIAPDADRHVGTVGSGRDSSRSLSPVRRASGRVGSTNWLASVDVVRVAGRLEQRDRGVGHRGIVAGQRRKQFLGAEHRMRQAVVAAGDGDMGEGLLRRPRSSRPAPSDRPASARAAIIRPFQSVRTLLSRPGRTRFSLTASNLAFSGTSCSGVDDALASAARPSGERSACLPSHAGPIA